MSYAICFQTVRDSIKELKILNGDMFLYQYLTYNDLEQTVNAVPSSHNIYEKLPFYKSLKGKHGKLIIQTLNDQIEIRVE
jgi:hypothetical protein